MTTAFRTDRFTFSFAREVESSQSAFPIDVEHCIDELLLQSGNLPAELGEAPIASWVLARLRKIAANMIRKEFFEAADGGGYCFDLTVTREDKTVAAVQLQGDMIGVVLIGWAESEETGGQIFEDFTRLLLSAPQEVDLCRCEVYDPEWEEDPDCYTPTPSADSRNEYGWNGTEYLGRFNIREDV